MVRRRPDDVIIMRLLFFRRRGTERWSGARRAAAPSALLTYASTTDDPGVCERIDNEQQVLDVSQALVQFSHNRKLARPGCSPPAVSPCGCQSHFPVVATSAAASPSSREMAPLVLGGILGASSLRRPLELVYGCEVVVDGTRTVKLWHTGAAMEAPDADVRRTEFGEWWLWPESDALCAEGAGARRSLSSLIHTEAQLKAN